MKIAIREEEVNTFRSMIVTLQTIVEITWEIVAGYYSLENGERWKEWRLIQACNPLEVSSLSLNVSHRNEQCTIL